MPCPKTPFPRHALPKKFGDNVEKAREKQGWSKSRLAQKAGVDRKTIARLESGKTTPSLQLVRALMRDEVLGHDLSLIKGWELDDPDSWKRGALVRSARLASGQKLIAIVKLAGGSVASLSAFERDLLAPFAFVGCKPQDDDGSGVSEAYACALGFFDAADMRAYLRSDDPMPWLDAIAKAHGRPLPTAALLPTRRVRDDDDADMLPAFLLD